MRYVEKIAVAACVAAALVFNVADDAAAKTYKMALGDAAGGTQDAAGQEIRRGVRGQDRRQAQHQDVPQRPARQRAGHG